MPRRTPATDRAERYLRELVEKQRQRSSPRLPVVGRLARDAGVSLVSMLAAVRRLRNAGVVTVSHGRGIRVAPPEDEVRRPDDLAADRGPARSARRWQRLRYELERDILNGRYTPGEILPPAKELAGRYGVCHSTLARAIATLERDGRLLAYRKRYRVPALRRPETGNTVVLVARGDADGNLAMLSPRIEEHLRTLERECAKAQVRLAVYTYTDWNDQLFGPGPAPVPISALHTAGVVLGYLVWVTGISLDSLDRLLARLASGQRPIALLSEHRPEIPPWALKQKCRPSVFDTGYDHRAGLQAGHYLLDLGHRHVAFVSPVHRAPWSVRRLEGLTEALAHHGSVRVCALGMSGQSEFVGRGSAEVAAEARRQLQAVIGGGQMPLTYTPSASARSLSAAIEQDAMGVALEPLLEQALADTRITAWVVASDSIALLCLDFLRRHAVPVPDRISVMAFDDALDAFLYRLTSYNFNGSAAVHAMLAAVLQGAGAPWSGRAVYQQFDGFITERSTTARAPSG